MTDIRIIYENDEGGVTFLIPILDCGLSLDEIIAKDVPAGKPYKVMTSADLPSDSVFRDAWEFQP